MPPANSGVSLELLPDPLIGHIFVQAGREEGVSAAGRRQGWRGVRRRYRSRRATAAGSQLLH